jgi:hypothetical protein
MAVLNRLMPVLKYVLTNFRTAKDSGRDLVAVSVGPEFQGRRGHYMGVHKVEGAQLSHDKQV